MMPSCIVLCVAYKSDTKAKTERNTYIIKSIGLYKMTQLKPIRAFQRLIF